MSEVPANVDDYLERLAIEGACARTPRTAGADAARRYRNDTGNGAVPRPSHAGANLAQNTTAANTSRFHITSLGDNAATVTTLAGDVSYEHVFSGQPVTAIRPGTA